MAAKRDAFVEFPTQLVIEGGPELRKALDGLTAQELLELLRRPRPEASA